MLGTLGDEKVAIGKKALAAKPNVQFCLHASNIAVGEVQVDISLTPSCKRLVSTA